MSAGTVSLCYNFLFFSIFVFVSADQNTIAAKPGEDVILPCRAPNNYITAAHWKRADPISKYVLVYQDGHFDPFFQHPSFKNRVDLQDRQIKDGDVSLILKDVKINDAEKYMCYVFMEETNSWELINTISLVVDSPEPKIITTESGQDVTLTCRAPNSKVMAVEWERYDLGEEYVLLYQDGHFDPANQHPFFNNRVDLQDRQMKDGDVSLILRDVTIHDNGTYECRVFMEETRSWKSISSINLIVTDEKIIKAKPGQDVTLPCRAPNNNILALEWDRDDLKSGKVFSRFGCDIFLDGQHPSFKNRVDLRDRQMKDGDVSLILKDVTIHDAGTYDCAVAMEGTNLFKHSIIHLVVDPPGQTGGDRDEL